MHYRREAAKDFLKTFDNFENFAEIMDVIDETHVSHSCYAAGKNICTIFLGVQNTF